MSFPPRTPNYLNQPVAGALFVVSSSFVFAILGALVKVVSIALTNEQIVFFRNIFALVFILPWLWYSRPPGGLRTNCLKLHMLRSVVGLGAMYAFFYAIAHLKLSESFLLIATAPLFIPVIAYVWMGESVPNHVRGAIIIGFIGIILILKPGFGIFKPVGFIGLASGILAAFAMVCIRRMSATEPAIRIVFYFTLFSTLISTGPLLWSWHSPQPKLWGLLILIGLLAVFGQLMLTKGYSLAPAAQMGPFTYANIVFATFIGWIFWGEILDPVTWVGAFLICIAGIAATRQTETHVLVEATADTSHTVKQSETDM